MNHRFFLAACVIVAGLFGAGTTEAKSYPDWDGHSPFFAMNGVVEFQGKVYGTSRGGIFRYDPEAGEYTLYYKNHGLDSNDVQCVAASSRYLFFGFQTAGLLRFDPETERFEQIRFPEYVPNGIAIRSITVQNDSTLLVGHSAGFDILDLRTETVRTIERLGTIPPGTPVNDVKVIKGKIWACTSLGLAVADADNPNLEAESNWRTYIYYSFGKLKGLNCIMHVKDEYEDMIYIGTEEAGIIYFDEAEDRFYETAVTTGSVYDMTAARGEFWGASTRGLMNKRLHLWSVVSDKYIQLTSVCGAGEKVWVASQTDGLQCHTAGGYVDVAPVPGPRNTSFRRIEIGGDGSVWTSSGYRHNYGDVLRFKDDRWSRYIKGEEAHPYSPFGLSMDVAGNLWFSMWGRNDAGPSGIMVIPDAANASPDSTPVPLNPERDVIKATDAFYYVICTDVMRDSRGNMWVANYQLNQPDNEGGRQHNIEEIPSSGAVVLDGFPFTKYRHFSPLSGDLETAKVSRIWADDDGWVWVGTDQYGLMAVKYGDNPFDTTVPTQKFSLIVADGLSSLKITALHHDADGLMWVGSEGGLDLVRKKIGGGLDVEAMSTLLDRAARNVYAIEVDRFNNKWIGTSNGLVRINAANTSAEVYNTGNSGLFSDTIFSLRYDEARDVLWIGTDAGLNTFSVLGGQSQDNARVIRVYPNPFSIWGADSRCTFDNLSPDGTLRIYTFNGDLVNDLKVTETSSKGSHYVTWNGRNFKNEYVGSGVYFFTGQNSDGKTVFRDKMVIIRR